MKSKLSALLVSLFAIPCIGVAVVPPILNFQGRLVDGTNLYNGPASIVLEVFTNETGGAAIYADSNTVAVADGIYSTYLGDDQTTFGNLADALTAEEVWVQVVVNNLVLSPRYRLVSSAFALLAANAETIGGEPATNIATKTSLAIEKAARESSDGSIVFLVNLEVSSRANADTALNNSIMAEATMRGAGDVVLSNSIVAEASARGAEDLALQGVIAAGDAAVQSAFASGDAVLQSQLDTKLGINAWLTANSTTNFVKRTGDRMSGNLDMGGRSITNIANNSLKFADGSTISTGTVSQWNTAYAWGNHASYSYASQSTLALEEAARISSYNTVLGAINLETVLRTDADTLLGDSVSAETSARIASDASLQSQVNATVSDIATLDADKLDLAGGTMTGILDMGGHSITNLGNNSLTFADGSTVSTGSVAQWNAAYSWGDHDAVGYLTSFTEVDPSFSAWLSGYAETDPVFGSSAASGITAENINDWSTAYGWGNHALIGYLTAELDPFFSVSPAAEISAGDILNWEKAYSWGNHASAGYATAANLNAASNSLQSQVNANAADIATLDAEKLDLAGGTMSGTLDMGGHSITNLGNNSLSFADGSTISTGTVAQWNTAYSWGDHDAVGYLTSFTEVDPSFTVWLSSYAESDPVFGASAASGITAGNVYDWSTAYGWGNHALVGYLTSFTELDPVWTTASTGYYSKTEADSRFVDVTGDTMTGALTINSPGLVIRSAGSELSIGSGASGLALGVAIGPLATGNTSGVAVGYGAVGDNGVAVGRGAVGMENGAALGREALAGLGGVAVGYQANGQPGGVAVGNTAKGERGGAALGYGADATLYGVAIGYYAKGPYTNIAIGNYARADGGINRVAIGNKISNAVNDSVAMRGTLYLDGAEGVYTRPVFGSGAWTAMATGTPLYAFTESDPIFAAVQSSLATGSPVYVESDPLFSASVAAAISAANTSQWSTAYSWGNHGAVGYLTSFIETDPSFTAWLSGYAEYDPMFGASAASGITAGNIYDWSTAYGWGNHALVGYLTSFTETDPLFSASVASAISVVNTSQWTTAYSWGNHASAGYATAANLNAASNSLQSQVNANAADIATLDADKLDLAGGTMSGTLDMGGHSITNLGNNSLSFADGSTVSTGSVAQWNTAYSWGNHGAVGYLTSYTETDPFFVGSTAAGIVGTDVDSWNNAVSWGNHALVGYLTSFTETDPLFSASVASAISVVNTSQWTTAYSWGNHSSAGYATAANLNAASNSLQSQVNANASDIATLDADKLDLAGGTMTGTLDMGGHSITNLGNNSLTFADGSTISTGSVSQWNAAYSWGNHASVGYLTSFTEADPLFSASVASAISVENTFQWFTAYSWGNHASAGYLTSFTEADPLFSASVASAISAVNTSQWSTAYSWGNHASAGYATAANLNAASNSLQSQVSANASDIATLDATKLDLAGGTMSGTLDMGGHSITNLGNNSLSFADGSTVSTGSVAQWNAAYSWGDHASVGYLTSFIETDPSFTAWLSGYTEYDPVFGASAASGITAGNIYDWSTAYGWGNHALVGYLTSFTEADPLFSASVASAISVVNTSQWTTAYSWGNHASAGYATAANLNAASNSLQSQVNANASDIATLDSEKLDLTGGTMTGTLDMGGHSITNLGNNSLSFADGSTISTGSVAQWNAAYSWGDHDAVGYLTSFTEIDPSFSAWLSGYAETDPVFGASPAATIANKSISDWNTAYSWGNHALVGYLTSFTEADPLFSASVASAISVVNTSQWSTAYSWGNHASAGYATAANLTTASNSLQSQVNANASDIATLDADKLDLAGGTMTGTLDMGGHSITNLGNNSLTFADGSTISTGSVAQWNTAYSWGNHGAVGYLTSFTELDPIYSASAASAISAVQIGNWDTVYGWGNHALVGYLTSFTETDPQFSASVASAISVVNTSQWTTAYSWGNHASAGYATAANLNAASNSLQSQVNANASDIATLDADKLDLAGGTMTGTLDMGGHSITNLGNNSLTFADGSTISTGSVSQWNTAYSWGNHGAVGYLTSFTETDPFFVGSTAAGIVGTDVDSWNNAVSWGNHALVGYLTSFTEADPLFSASVASAISVVNTSQWSTAYSWGNHASAGYATVANLNAASNSLQSQVNANASDIATLDADKLDLAGGTMTGTLDMGGHSITNLGNNSLTFADGSTISTGSVAQWNTAYSWGNHGAVGYLTSFTELDPIYSASAASAISVVQIGNWDAAYGWGNHALVGYLTSFTEADPLFSASVASAISVVNTSQWSTAYSWGSHASAGYATAANLNTASNSLQSQVNANASDIATLDADKLDLAGGTMTGSLTNSSGFAGPITLASSGSATAGTLIYDGGVLKVHNGTAWVPVNSYAP